jgi:hypothetical protein
MPLYRERLWPAPWLFIATALVIPATLLVFQPINETVGVITAVVLYASCVALLLLASPVIEVTPTEFKAGRASIPLEQLGEVRGFEGDDATLARGRNLDARAWPLIRGWVGPVVTLEVADERDPVPYWIVSTRQPKRLAESIAEAKRRTPGR